jgi:serine/threonine-protein kinase
MFLPGHRLGCHEILGVIAEGGTATVFDARDTLLKRPVAIKVARNSLAAGSLLHKEGQALAAIRHPGVVSVYGMGSHKGHDYLVMERVHGQCLESVGRRATRPGTELSLAEIVRILTGIAEALVAIHAAGIAHCDVKPANVMLSGARVVLMDLGIFRAEYENPHALVAGTPHYMAPEVILNRLERGAWHLADLYALGVVAFELVHGAPPFLGRDVDTVFDAHVSTPPPDLLALHPEIPAALASLIQHLLEKNPADRVESAEVALWCLQAIARELAHPHRRPLAVLVVDDDPDAIELLQEVVRRAVRDVEVITASTSRQALATLEQRTPDLMLVDVNLPDMNGLELCMYLRGAHLVDSCPIIMVSAEADDGDVRLLGKLGVRHFVRKGPGISDRLGAAIRTVSPPPLQT